MQILDRYKLENGNTSLGYWAYGTKGFVELYYKPKGKHRQLIHSSILGGGNFRTEWHFPLRLAKGDLTLRIRAEGKQECVGEIIVR